MKVLISILEGTRGRSVYLGFIYRGTVPVVWAQANRPLGVV